MKLKRFLVILLVIILSITSTAIMLINADTPRLYGDINNDGKINGMDLLLMKKIILGVDLSQFSEEDIKYADVVTHTGTVNGMRLLMLKKCILGIIGPEDLQPAQTETTKKPYDPNAPSIPLMYKLIDWSETNLVKADSIFNVTVGGNRGTIDASKTNEPDVLTTNRGQICFDSSATTAGYTININAASGKTEEVKAFYKSIFDRFEYIDGLEFDLKVTKFDRQGSATETWGDFYSIYSHLLISTSSRTASTRSLELQPHKTSPTAFPGKDLNKEFTLRVPFQELNLINSGNFSSFVISTQNNMRGMTFYISDIYVYGWEQGGKHIIPTHDDNSVSRIGFRGNNYNLKFIDDFDKTELDEKYWNYQITHFNANEKAAYLKERVEVKDGSLFMYLDRAESEIYSQMEQDWSNGGKPKEKMKTRFGGAALITTNKVHFQYGMLEFKVKAPWGVGIWSGLWTTGTGQGWPWGGEIDMFEFVGGGGRDDHWPVCMHFCAPNTPSADAWSGNKHISGNLNVHYGSESSKEYKDLYLKPGQTKLADDWHIIGIEWTNKEMIFYIDGIRFKSVDITGDEASFAYHNPHQIHLQMSCDTGGWAGDANGNPELAAGRMQVMEIDWVKVWQSDEIPGSKFPVGSNK